MNGSGFIGAQCKSQSQEPYLTPQLLSLLGELESSLRASQRALLSRNIASVEELTRRQSELQHALANIWTSQKPTIDRSGEFSCALEHVLHLGRIQKGLLTRLQRNLMMLSRLAAGTHMDYSFAAGQTSISLYSTSVTSREA